MTLYNNLSGYFRDKYHKRLGKICIDGGFSCPNRDGRCGINGCIYCGERGAGEHIDPGESITQQVKNALKNAKPDDLFVAYFQNFTNTYAENSVLKSRYDAALIDERIKVLAIGTRPDCITEENAKLIASYKEKCDVWVELGLQTANDKTAKIINRGYPREVFESAMEILKRHDIPVVVHLIVGLPGESIDDVKKTTEYVNNFHPFGIKIHSIYVMEGTKLAEMYKNGEFTPPTQEEYVNSAVYIITHTSRETVIHRLTGDCPRDLLVAPEWNLRKTETIDKITGKLQAKNLSQGSECK